MLFLPDCYARADFMATSVSAKGRFPSYSDNSVAATDFPINKIRGNEGDADGQKKTLILIHALEGFFCTCGKKKKSDAGDFLVGCIFVNR